MISRLDFMLNIFLEQLQFLYIEMKARLKCSEYKKYSNNSHENTVSTFDENFIYLKQLNKQKVRIYS